MNHNYNKPDQATKPQTKPLRALGLIELIEQALKMTEQQLAEQNFLLALPELSMSMEGSIENLILKLTEAADSPVFPPSSREVFKTYLRVLRRALSAYLDLKAKGPVGLQSHSINN